MKQYPERRLTSPSPVRDRLIGFLRQAPEGMTTAEMAGKLGKSVERAGQVLGRAADWGYIRKIPGVKTDGRSAHEFNLWKLPS